MKLAPIIPAPALFLAGIIEAVDGVTRDLKIRVAGDLLTLDVPPDCPVFVGEERVKFRFVQSQDWVEATYLLEAGTMVARSLRVSRHRPSQF